MKTRSMRHRRATATARVAALLAIAACGGASGDGTAPARALDLTQVARIEGGADAGGAGFGRIADIEIGRDGTVYVLDALNRVVYTFDEHGAALGAFGGRGGGPGELEGPTALFLGPDGNVWVVDAGNARYTVFDAAGSLVGTYRSSDANVFYPLAVGHTAAGQLYTVVMELGRLEQPTAVLVESAVVNGEVRALRQVELPFVAWPPPFEHRGDGMMMVLPVPFAPQPAFQIDGDGRLWYASTGDPWVHRWATGDSMERSYGRDFEAPPVRASDRETALGEAPLEELRAATGGRGVAELTGRIPDRKPHLRGFFVDDAGNVWIMRTPASGDDEAAAPVELYDSGGALTGVVHVALEPEPRPRVRGGLLAGVVRDELDVETVVLYRIGPD